VRTGRRERFRCGVLGAAFQLKVSLCQKPTVIAEPTDSVCCFEHCAAATSELGFPAPMRSNRAGGDAAAFELDRRLRRDQPGANVWEA
jgi:hypothetical protein